MKDYSQYRNYNKNTSTENVTRCKINEMLARIERIEKIVEALARKEIGIIGHIDDLKAALK